MLDNFASEFVFCWACGCPDRWTPETMTPPNGWRFVSRIDYPRHLEIHHLVGGAARTPHDRRNLARLCKLCHDLAEGLTVRWVGRIIPNLRLDHRLWLKHRSDREFYNKRFLRTLRPKVMPPLRKPPAWFAYHRLGFQTVDW